MCNNSVTPICEIGLWTLQLMLSFWWSTISEHAGTTIENLHFQGDIHTHSEMIFCYPHRD